jgi:GAF domain-containing protein
MVRPAAAYLRETHVGSAAEVSAPGSLQTGGPAVAGNQIPRPAAEALEHLGRLSVRDLSMKSLLETVAQLAKSAMPGDTEASVTLLVKDRPATVASTGQLALDLDETQYQYGQGPCLHAARSGELTEITDTRTEMRWPHYTARAAEQGNISSLSVPLCIDEHERVSGALNLYAGAPGAFDAGSRSAAQAFGPYAAVAAGNLYAYQNARDMADNLQLALESRAVIDQAKGVLMERHRLTADQAFQALAQASMRANRKVRDIAEHLVATGEFPITSLGPSRRSGQRPPPGRPAS